MNTAWPRFAEFCDRHSRDFIPRSSGKRAQAQEDSRLHRRCADLLVHGDEEPLGVALHRAFPDEQERPRALAFLRACLEDRWRPRGGRPLEQASSVVSTRLRGDATRLADFLERGLGEQRDLVALDALADIFQRYQGSRSTYLMLCALHAVLPEPGKGFLDRSTGFADLLAWGATPFLRDFWFRFQRQMGATRVAIKTEAAQNLARELSETEDSLRMELEQVRARLAATETELARLREESQAAAMLALGIRLQERPNPVLDQMVETLERLQERAENDGFGLTGDLLSALIILEEVLEGLRSLGLQHFPQDLAQPLVLTEKDLSRYQYTRGTPFRAPGESRRVRCLKPGWEVAGRVITPARVEEIEAIADGIKEER